MLQNSSASVLTIPISMVLITVLLFFLRIGVSSYEALHPVKTENLIHWTALDDIKQLKTEPDISQKPYLIYFWTKKGYSNKEAEANTFSNRYIVNLVNNNYVPIKIEVNSQEDLDKVEYKYNIYGLPALVAALANGKRVDARDHSDSFGPGNTPNTLKFLQGSLAKLEKQRGLAYFERGDYVQAAKSFNQFLSGKIKADEYPDVALYDFIAMKKNHDLGNAQKLLTDNFISTSKFWPECLIYYLKGDISKSELLNLAKQYDEDYDEENGCTTANYVVGIDLILKGNIDEGKKHLLWVKDHGDKSSVEYNVALRELEELATKKYN